MGTKKPRPSGKNAVAVPFIEKQYIHIYKKVKNSKNRTIEFETKVGDSLEGCYLVSFVSWLQRPQ